ncbi:MAG: PaaX family transcriptional regulator C-terminal domain-containing protein [Acidimicrobiales bacterium]|nr:PaaX family transcriptional regulator C-terminal domain-containing protein [Acidimicrobiales bacterium]
MSTIRDTQPSGDRRPLTARSVIASTLLGVDPPRLPALALVRSGELFGLREGATRTALSRMTTAGEVAAEDGHYALTGPLLERHARQQSALAATDRDWDGTWIGAVVTAERRSAAERSAFRDAARRLELAEVREGFWARPGEPPSSAGAEARRVVDEQATWLRGIRPDDPVALTAAFELDAWAAGARALIDEMRRWQPALDDRRTDVLGETFVIAAAVLRHLVADPQLPTALLPPHWPGPELRDVFASFDDAFKATWRTWYRAFDPG